MSYRLTKLWLVRFEECGFRLDAVVVEQDWGHAIALLKLPPGAKVLGQPECLGDALDVTPRVVTQDKLELA